MPKTPQAPPATKKRLVKLEVVTADDKNTVWTRDADGLDAVTLTESNVIIVHGTGGESLMVYSPMMWLTARSHYEEIPE